MKNTKSSDTNEFASANSAAIIALGWYLFCRLFYIPFPGVTEWIFQSWFPALDLQLLWSQELLGQLVVGIVTFPLAVWITVYLFVKLYKSFLVY